MERGNNYLITYHNMDNKKNPCYVFGRVQRHVPFQKYAWKICGDEK